MIIRLFSACAIKHTRKIPWRMAWRKSARVTSTAADVFYTCILIAILLCYCALWHMDQPQLYM